MNNTTIIISLVGAICALTMVLIAMGRLVWILSSRMQAIEGDLVLVKETTNIKLIHLENELAEVKAILQRVDRRTTKD